MIQEALSRRRRPLKITNNYAGFKPSDLFLRTTRFYRMEAVTKTWVKVLEWQKRLSRGQTMTEYALIMAAVAIVVFITYETMGQDIGSLVNKVNTDLTTAS
jgi:Flp pilus assembly pilin Flp